MINEPSVDAMIRKLGSEEDPISRYALCTIAAKRARQILETNGHILPTLRYSHHSDDRQFRHPLALFCMVQPNIRLHNALGYCRVAASQRKMLLDCPFARPFYDGGQLFLHTCGARRSFTSSFLWNHRRIVVDGSFVCLVCL